MDLENIMILLQVRVLGENLFHGQSALVIDMIKNKKMKMVID